MSCVIETACIKDVIKEKVLHFYAELCRIISEHNIRLENIFNADETGIQYFYYMLTVGCSIGSTQTSNVVVDTSVGKGYKAQPGRQEWVTVIECVSATGEKVGGCHS